jgi:hypothetical protein
MAARSRGDNGVRLTIVTAAVVVVTIAFLIWARQLAVR